MGLPSPDIKGEYGILIGMTSKQKHHLLKGVFFFFFFFFFFSDFS